MEAVVDVADTVVTSHNDKMIFTPARNKVDKCAIGYELKESLFIW